MISLLKDLSVEVLSLDISVHDLAVELLNSQYRCRVGRVRCGGVFQADEIVVMALTVNSLQNLITICEEYSTMWRYQYNAVRLKIIVFGEFSRKKNV